MLVIRVELHSAITGKVTEIARMIIYNDGSGNSERGNYVGRTIPGVLAQPTPTGEMWRKRPMRIANVLNYARRSKHVWHLVACMLKEMRYGR